MNHLIKFCGQGVLMAAMLSVGLGSSATAADVFNACSNNHTGKVRAASIEVNATPVCHSTETARTWSQSPNLFADVDGRTLTVVSSSQPAPTVTRRQPAGDYILTFSQKLDGCVAVISDGACTDGTAFLDQPQVTWGATKPSGEDLIVDSYDATTFTGIDTCFNVIIACP